MLDGQLERELDLNSLFKVFHGKADKQDKLMTALISKGVIEEEFSQDETKKEMVAIPSENTNLQSQTVRRSVQTQVVGGDS